jgi:hypothetical protein
VVGHPGVFFTAREERTANASGLRSGHQDSAQMVLSKRRPFAAHL